MKVKKKKLKHCYKNYKMLTEYWPFKKFYKTKVDILDQEKDQLKYLLYKFNSIKHSVDKDQTTTYKSINVLNLPRLKNLRNQIIKIIESKNLILGNNWAQLYLKGSQMSPHLHNNSSYGGIIYVDGDSAEGTSFIDSYSGHTHTEKFEKNTLILFPANIIHFVKYQEQDTRRIVIAFNTVGKVY